MFNFLPVLPTISGFSLSENAAISVHNSQPLTGASQYSSVGIKKRSEGSFLKGLQSYFFLDLKKKININENIFGMKNF